MAYKDDIEKVFRNEYGSMHRLAAVILHDREAAKDVVHDVFAGLLQMRWRADADGAPTHAYLTAAVRNRCLKHLRGLEVRERFRNLYLFENGDGASESTPAKESPDMDELFRHIDGELPEVCRKIFEMRFIENLKMSEIAASVGIGERMAYKYLSHAVDVVRNIIRREYE